MERGRLRTRSSTNRFHLMTIQSQTNRRQFLKTTVLGSAAAFAAQWTLPKLTAAEAGASTKQITSRVALTAGEDRAQLAFQGLKAFKKTIAHAIGNKRIIIKPN